MSHFQTISFDDDDEIEKVDQEKNDEKKSAITHQSSKPPPSKLQNGSVKKIEKLIINQSKSSAIDSENIVRFKALIERKIDLLKCNPMEFMYGEKMETYKQKVLEIMQTAASQEGLMHFDKEWLTKQINEKADDKDEQENMRLIRNYIQKLAQAAIYEAKLHNNSINLIANRVRRMRIDEFQRIEEQKQLKEIDRLFPGKRKYFMGVTIKKEEYSSPPTNNSNAALRSKFLLNNEEDYIGDIFAKSNSPPSPPQMGMDSLCNDNDIGMDEEIVQPKKYRDYPISDIVHRPKNDSIRLSTPRQELIQRITGHVQNVPENDQQKGNSKKYENEQKKKIKKTRGKINNKQRHLPSKKTIQYKPSNTYDSELEDYYLNEQSSSSSELYCEYKRMHKIPYENDKSIKLGQIPVNIIKKSCLKKNHGLKAKKKIKFLDEIEDNEGKSKNNPGYDKQHFQSNVGQNTSKFTCLPKILTSRENLQMDEKANFKMIPSSDHPILIKFRTNPNKNSKSEQGKIKKEIYDDLINEMNFPTSRLFIMDSILTQLDKEIFKNMSCFEMNFPRMPQWLIDVLEDWWKANLDRTIQQYFCYSKVFILIGMDLNIFYADPNGHPDKLIHKFLIDLSNWFDQKIKIIRNNLKQNDDNIWKEYTFEIEIEDTKIKKRRLYLNEKPQFVVITIPEVGDWAPFFHGFNIELRKFIDDNSANFTLLDWAHELEQMNKLEVATVEQRTAILIKRMHTDHAVLYI